MSLLTTSTQRRTFLGRITAGVAVFVAGRWSSAAAEIPHPTEVPGSGDDWVARITGKHRQVFDCTTANMGFGAAFGLNFVDSVKEAYKLTDKDVTAVIVYRHFAMPLVLNDSMWAKYKIGEFLNVNDPKTNAPATRNIFRDNVPGRPGMVYEQVMADRGVIMTACNVALTVLSGMVAKKGGVSADDARKEWTANLLPGVHLAVSGVYAVNRTQEVKCTYCNGG
jgi:hypothetical protein